MNDIGEVRDFDDCGQVSYLPLLKNLASSNRIQNQSDSMQKKSEVGSKRINSRYQVGVLFFHSSILS